VPDHFQTIYRHHADQYERMIAREDYQGYLQRFIEGLFHHDGLGVVECGAGTGRLTRIMVRHARRVLAFDASAHMLGVAEPILKTQPQNNWSLGVADHRYMPLPENCADIVIEGWAFGHYCDWYPATWQLEIGQAIKQMQRLLRPGGIAVVIETLGTGVEEPMSPTPQLADFYAMLEQEWGFARTVIRTDYRFASLDEAVELTNFFFGAELAAAVRVKESSIVPECTGIWQRVY
jgi:ubiquinone/menaquinone biosynthesis C-methylase UbiE